VPVNHLEIGVSLGKTFMQLSQHFRSGDVVGLDVEDISPGLRAQFKAAVQTRQSPKAYDVETLSGEKRPIQFGLKLERGEDVPPASCVFRRSRPSIPSEGGHPFQSKPARDSDDPGHLRALALVSALASVHVVGSASSF